MPQTLTRKEIIALRLTNNGLYHKFDSISACCEALVGIQAQVLNFAEISLFHRVSPAITTNLLEKQYKQHTLVRGWGQRGTAHLYLPQDWQLASEVYFHNNTWKERLRQKDPVRFDVMVNHIHHKSNSTNILSKMELIELIQKEVDFFAEEKLFYEYFFFSYCSMSGAYAGIPKKPYPITYVSKESLSLPPTLHSDTQQKKQIKSLMRRYFTSYGPATINDFCHWSGLRKSLVKNAFDEVSPSLTHYQHNGRDYYMSYDYQRGSIQRNYQRVYLLGKFDPLFVSYSHKDWIVSEAEEKEIWRSSARVEAVLLIGLKPYGTWRYEQKNNALIFRFYLWETLTLHQKKQVEKAAKRLSTFMKKTYFNSIFYDNWKSS